MSKKYLYYFSEGNEAFGGDKVTMKNTLGGKGAGLAEMTAAGMPVPQGFTITTDACTQYYADGRQINDEITADIFEHLKGLEKITGKKFGDNTNPLLVSVRSGARQSMPGMMDTILNLGLNDEAVEGLAKKTGNTRFAYDCYRRFVQMFADVVMMVPKSLFEVEIDKMKEAKGVKNDVDLTADDLKELDGTFKKIYEENEGRPFPQDPRDQLIEAVKAVFRSWDNPRANVYRKMNEIPYEWGTAVNVQQMAFGNSGDRSGTGVAFTRDPATGAKKLMGEYLINAQGEDVVAGVRTPSPISHLKDQMPEVYDQFVEIATRLENYFRDMQDMEFTIEDGHLYMLQTRNGKRTAQAALQIACDLVDEGMITEQEAVLRVEPKQLDTLLHPQFDAAALKAAEVVGKGLAASPGSACGQIVFTAEEAEEMVKSGKMKKVVLVRLETSPEDIVGMQVSQGILTVRGGMTSHAAVVARGMGTCCVSGCGNDNEVKIDEEAKTFEINGHKFVEGDWISIDGSTGNICGEQVATVAATGNKNFNRFMGWADAARQLLVMTNADNPRDAQQAVDLGAEGIGLCRTEHMFFAEDRIKAVREMICARTVEEREAALAKVSTKDLGEVGDMITDLIGELKSFDANEEQQKGIMGFFKKKTSQLDALKTKYDKTETNVEKIQSMLEAHQVQLLKDIAMLDKMYELNMAYFKELSMYILAGKKKLADVRANELQQAMDKAKVSGLPEDAQAARDLADQCERFEKKLYDLELTRNISLQMGPQIRLLQNNNTMMAEKIQSTIVNTIPLWKNQMVLALGLAHSQQAMQAERAVTNMTNDLLKKNAEALKLGTIETAKESERGVVDIETLQQTNKSLIETLDELNKIQSEGRAKRAAAEQELTRIEDELKTKMMEIRS